MNHNTRRGPDIARFTEDDSLPSGYRTALQIRLQYAKGDPEAFDTAAFSARLAALGTQMSAAREGTLVRLSLMTPDPAAVLALCQTVGEFLTVKIENPVVLPDAETPAAPRKPRKPYGVVAVSCGDGIRASLTEMGADTVPDGTHPLTAADFAEAYAAAYAAVNAGTLLVFPGSPALTAPAGEAAKEYGDADVRVIPADNLGAVYAALSVLDTSSGDTDAIADELTEACADVVTASVTAVPGGYAGILDGRTLCSSADRTEAVTELAAALHASRHDVLLLFAGASVPAEEARAVYDGLSAAMKRTEVILIDGGMTDADYLLSPQ